MTSVKETLARMEAAAEHGGGDDGIARRGTLLSGMRQQKSPSLPGPSPKQTKAEQKVAVADPGAGEDDLDRVLAARRNAKLKQMGKAAPAPAGSTKTPGNAGGDAGSGVTVATTPAIFAAVAVAVATRKLPPQLANALEPYGGGGGGGSDLAEISFATLQQLSRFLRSSGAKADQDQFYLHALMTGSTVVKQSPIKPPPSAELLERRRILQNRADECEYQRLAKDVAAKDRAAAQAPLDVVEGRRVFSLVVNLIITMFACFAFGWFATRTVYPSVAGQALAGIVCMVLAVGAELYFIMKMQLDDPKRKQRIKKAKKEAREMMNAKKAAGQQQSQQSQQSGQNGQSGKSLKAA